MSRKLSITLAVAMILIVALGFVGPVYAETFGEYHASIGPALPTITTNDACLKCHSGILKGGESAGVNAFHIKHVESMSMSCTQCHKVDEELPTLKPLVSEDTCVTCHKEGGMGRVIYTGAREVPTTTTPTTGGDAGETPPTTTGDSEEDTAGFEAIFAATGLIAVAYLVLRRNK